MDKDKKAKKIMLESGFVTKYHHILDIMRGNMKSDRLRHESVTILWACDVIKNEINLLKRKHPDVEKELQQQYWPYYEDVRRLHDEVWDKILDNIKMKHGKNNEINDGDNKEEADNSN